MTKVLITGATGNVGMEVIKSLQLISHNLEVYAGVRDVAADQAKLASYNVQLLAFDFTDAQTYRPALMGCDVLFLLRPPQIADVPKYFKPIIDTCKDVGVGHIVFLSVQGVEKSTIIPHHKIEKLIVASKIPYTFLRPAYFMQNFTTTLCNDLVNHKRIYLPAGNAKFTLVDVRDVGAVAARVITNVTPHINKAYELTSTERLTFGEMAGILSRQLGVDIQFKSSNLLAFYLSKKKEQVPTMFILVMIMLHYLPRFQKPPETTQCIQQITGKPCISFEQFVTDYKTSLL
ncbi:SDR family oxidoreductase [soil metagenome]